MEPGNSVKKEIDDIIDSLDGIKRAEMPAFFYTRLQAGMEKRATGENGFWKMFTRPAVTLLTLSLLVILNIATIRYFTKRSRMVNHSETSAIQNFANEYDLGITSVYSDTSVK